MNVIAGLFSDFCSNLRFQDSTMTKIRLRYHSITQCMNDYYWGIKSDDAHSLYVGSYGRGTEIHSSDIDILIPVPRSIYDRFRRYVFNGPSQFLQEVKRVIGERYSTTFLRADGQIIRVPFSDGINFEILPAIENLDGSFLFANSNSGGAWETTDPRAEIRAVNELNNGCNHNLKRLCRMMRAWRDSNQVDISGIVIDILCYRFLKDCPWREKTYIYYDWMSRDCFEYFSQVPTWWRNIQVMGSNRSIPINPHFQRKARNAYDLAVSAISSEKSGSVYTASSTWRQIYGTRFKIY